MTDTGMQVTDVLVDEPARSRREHRAEPLYVGRIGVYPKAVVGAMRRFKTAALILLLGLYYLAPWLRWDRGAGVPDQALLIDLPARRAYFFGLEIWPQQVYYLTAILILAALGLFLASSLFGRVWCGFSCPQTVWTDLFTMVERWIEGDRNARMRLDKSPMTGGKVAKKIAKHAAWLGIALFTGGAWVMYFTDAPSLVRNFFVGEASGTAYFFVGLFTFTTYLLAGWAREQVCIYMCPWPRIQGAMVDEDTLVVSYESWRGEPRGKHKAGTSWEGRGHCIDCTACVAACPMGIDIRDGYQLECIGCGLCIDACDRVMEKVGLPRKLIAFDTERNRAAKLAGKSAVWRLLRPRTVAYAALLLAATIGLLASLLSRADLDINVLPDRAPLFVRLSDGRIQNAYTLKILNMQRAERRFTLAVEGVDGAHVSVVGAAEDGSLAARPDQVATYRVLVNLPPAALDGATTPIAFRLIDVATGAEAAHDTIFRGPGA